METRSHWLGEIARQVLLSHWSIPPNGQKYGLWLEFVGIASGNLGEGEMKRGRDEGKIRRGNVRGILC